MLPLRSEAESALSGQPTSFHRETRSFCCRVDDYSQVCKLCVRSQSCKEASSKCANRHATFSFDAPLHDTPTRHAQQTLGDCLVYRRRVSRPAQFITSKSCSRRVCFWHSGSNSYKACIGGDTQWLCCVLSVPHGGVRGLLCLQFLRVT